MVRTLVAALWIAAALHAQLPGPGGGGSGSSAPSGSASGGLAGTYPNPTLTGVTTADRVAIVSGTPGVLVQTSFSYTDLVRGASNLTTVGAVPFVSASGVLDDDPTVFCWDATNDRLGVGNCAPSQPLHVTGNALLLGTVGIGPSNTSPTGTLHVYNATASTGLTRTWLREGAGQGGAESFGVYANDGTTYRMKLLAGALSVSDSVTSTSIIGLYHAFPSFGYSQAQSDGVWTFFNNASNSFGRLQLGGTTSSFPSLKRSTTGLVARLADDSTDTWVQASAIAGGGSTPSVATCGTIGTGSKNSAGFITSGTTGSCVSVLTFSGYTATTGWSCGITNGTTANIITQTGSSTTTATFTGTTVSGDVLRYNCTAF